MNKKIGNRIRAARMALGLPRREVGELMGLNESTIKRYEDGHIKGMSTEVIERFANVLGVSVAHLLGLEIQKEDILKGLTKDELELVKAYVDFLKSRRR
jgi:transcriptional regulator with XRE-family HTH domain